MRAEYLAAALTAKSKSLDDVGRSTKPYDERAAYLGRVSQQAMDYADVVYFGQVNEKALRRVYWNVLKKVSHDWQPIGEKPVNKEAWQRWRERNAHLIEKLVMMALMELLNTSVGQPNRTKWRAAQIGISERRWHQAYRERYDRITGILNDWDGEFCGKVYVNQRELQAV